MQVKSSLCSFGFGNHLCSIGTRNEDKLSGLMNDDYTDGIICPYEIPDQWQYEYDRQW